jgi:hypothetical protein
VIGWALGFAAAALAFAGTAVALAIRFAQVRDDEMQARLLAKGLEHDVGDLNEQLDDLGRRMTKQTAAHARLLAAKDAALAEAEQMLEQCNAPGVVRDRLKRGLLGDGGLV